MSITKNVKTIPIVLQGALNMVLHTAKPREQSGRDSFARYRAQVRSAAIASLQMLSGTNVDRVYCDLHDDVVVRHKDENGLTYVFYQVKTRGKRNQNWKLGEVFGIQQRKKDVCEQTIKDSFIGKMLLHTVIFDQYCNSVVFQTNIYNEDNIDDLLSDIENGKYANKFSRILLERFNSIFSDDIPNVLSEDEVKSRLSKLKFENDVPYLKEESLYFSSIVREKIYEYSEIELSRNESDDIIIKLLDIISRKSSGVIKPFTQDNIEKSASISISDLLPILSLSKEAYDEILKGKDPKAIKSVSIIQRTLESAGSSIDEVVFCSKCKTDWDVWYRNNRHIVAEMDLKMISNKIKSLLTQHVTNNQKSLNLNHLYNPIRELHNELKSDDLLFDLTRDHLLGAIFSELIKVSV